MDGFRASLEEEFGDPNTYTVEMKEKVKSQRAGKMTKYKKTTFEALPKEVQEEWEKKSKAKLEQAQKLYAEKVKELAARREEGPCTNPQDIQEYVLLGDCSFPADIRLVCSALETVAERLQNMLDDVRLETGWSFVCLGGGPEPIDGGRLTMLT